MAVNSLSKVSLAAHPLLLLGILGTSIAPLCGVSTGWAYYHTDHLHTISGSRPESAWVGYIRGSGTTTLLLHTLYPGAFPQYHYLTEYGNVGRVFGWLEVAFLALSIVLCTIIFLLWATTAARRKGARGLHTFTSPIAIIFGVILFGVTVAFYVLLAIGVSRGLKAQLGVALIPWPYWAWWLAIISSWLWLSLGTIAVCERRKVIRAAKQASQATAGSLVLEHLPPPIKH